MSHRRDLGWIITGKIVYFPETKTCNHRHRSAMKTELKLNSCLGVYQRQASTISYCWLKLPKSSVHKQLKSSSR